MAAFRLRDQEASTLGLTSWPAELKLKLTLETPHEHTAETVLYAQPPERDREGEVMYVEYTTAGASLAIRVWND